MTVYDSAEVYVEDSGHTDVRSIGNIWVVCEGMFCMQYADDLAHKLSYGLDNPSRHMRRMRGLNEHEFHRRAFHAHSIDGAPVRALPERKLVCHDRPRVHNIRVWYHPDTA